VEGKVAGKPFILEPWQKAFIGNLFGWVKENDSGEIVRRYREALLYVPRKNGKTPLSAAICLYMLVLDGEKGAQCYGAAAAREQATLLYRHAAGMVRGSPTLAKKCQIFTGHKSIVLREDQASSYVVLSAEAGVAHGQNPHLVLIDELHAQPNGNLVEVLESSMASENRAQPLMIPITTADWMRESVCNETYEYACKVRDGGISDPSFLPCIFEATAEDDWKSEETWKKANPNLGVSVSMEYLRRKFKKATEVPA